MACRVLGDCECGGLSGEERVRENREGKCESQGWGTNGDERRPRQSRRRRAGRRPVQESATSSGAGK